MKKFRFLIAMLLSAAFLIMATACGGGELQAPVGFNIDEDNTLSWGEVEGARSYRIRITPVPEGEPFEDDFRPAHYSLASLEEGDYEISVMSLGGSQANAKTSPWSPAILFHKDFETGLVYELINNNTEYCIQRVGAASGNVVIEDVYRGKPVTEIAERAFRASARITGIVIGKNVRTIGDFAFYNCQQLASVTIPDSVVQMGESVFQGCSALTEVKLPDSLQIIPVRAFAYCRKLEKVEFGAATYIIMDSAFYECSALKAADFPDSVAYIGDNAFASDEALTSVHFGSGLQVLVDAAFYQDEALTEVTFAPLDGELTIGGEAFNRCTSLTEITLPEGVTELGDYVFGSCEKLETVTLPESIRTVGTGVFNGTALYAAQADSGYVYAGNWLVSVVQETRNSLVHLDASVLKEGTIGIAASAFTQAAELLDVILPASVKYIGYRSFYQCPKLYHFTGEENGLEVVGNSALANCTGLSQLYLKEGLKEIDNYAFYGCTPIVNPNSGDPLVPNSVTRIGLQAFANTGVRAGEEDQGVIYASKWVVGYDETLSATPMLHENTIGIADYAFDSSETLTNLNRLNSVRYIGVGAFARCAQLSMIQLNANIREIQPYTFYKCPQLYDLGTLPRVLETIGGYAFYNCERLSAVDFSRTDLKSIGSHAFFECPNIETIVFSDKIEEIADYAFYHSEKLQELTIPGTVKSLGQRAFGMCSNLQTVTFGDGLEEIGAFAFRECTHLTSINLPDTVKTIGEYAFYLCAGVTSLKMSANVESIGKYAFYGNGFESVALPASLQYIGNAAFKACLNLRSVTLYGSVETMGANVFFANDESNSYGLNGVTIYVAGEVGEDWTGSWNPARRPVVEGCTFSDEGYLVSVTVGENGILNGHIWNGLSAPSREGYAFIGWAGTEDAASADYALNDLVGMPVGTTLYSVWAELPPVVE